MPINNTLTMNCNAKLKSHATLWGIQIMYVKIEVFWCGFLFYYEDSLNTFPYFLVTNCNNVYKSGFKFFFFPNYGYWKYENALDF